MPEGLGNKDQDVGKTIQRVERPMEVRIRRTQKGPNHVDLDIIAHFDDGRGRPVTRHISSARVDTLWNDTGVTGTLQDWVYKIIDEMRT